MARGKSNEYYEDATGDDGLEAKEDSSLTLPLTIIGVTLLLSLGFLYYYFGPSISELAGDVADPSESSAPVTLTVGGAEFRIPTNYTRFPKDRRGGERDQVSLYALLPDFEPFSHGDKETFEQESKTSPVIYFEINTPPFLLDEKPRLEKLYRDHIGSPPSQGPDGLTRYSFDGSTGYKDEDLFIFDEDTDHPVILRCYRETGTINMPSCRRDMNISDKLSISYRYQRHWLPQWRAIDAEVQKLVNSWMVDETTPAPAAADRG